MNDLVKRLTIKIGVMEMGERIPWGSDTALMREAVHRIEYLEKRLVEADSTIETLVISVLGEEEYDNSPCQAHPLELVENRVRELEEKVDTLLDGMVDVTTRCAYFEQDAKRYRWIIENSYYGISDHQGAILYLKPPLIAPDSKYELGEAIDTELEK